jgi:methylated-DNA-[protein]-cysteine S-methyltransferase
VDYVQKIPSPLGNLIALSDGAGVTGLWFSGGRRAPEEGRSGLVREDLPVFKKLREWLGIYFSGRNPPFTPPIALVGSDFRQAVWALLLEIPFGQVTTYGDIAGRLEVTTGKRQSPRAVGGAVGHNPVSIIVPCHRVIGAGGNLTGYGGGMDKKVALLRLEGVDTGKFVLPR